MRHGSQGGGQGRRPQRRDTDHTYDYTALLTYGHQGNRLVYSDTWSGGVQVEERWYRYDLEGRTDLVIRRIETDEDASGNQWHRGTRMYYNTSGQIWNAGAREGREETTVGFGQKAFHRS